MYPTPSGETPRTDRPAATFNGHRQFGPDHFPEVFMRRTRSMLVSAATLVLLGTLPTVAQGQAKDATSKDAMSKDGMSKDAMSKDAMSKDAMSKDAMSKDGMSKDGMSKDAMSKDAMSKDAMKDKGATMGKDADAMKQQGAAKGKPAMKEKDGMAEPSKMK
jgi:pentapeptide MXKDX repeat protein